MNKLSKKERNQIRKFLKYDYSRKIHKLLEEREFPEELLQEIIDKKDISYIIDICWHQHFSIDFLKKNFNILKDHIGGVDTLVEVKGSDMVMFKTSIPSKKDLDNKETDSMLSGIFFDDTFSYDEKCEIIDIINQYKDLL
jgi:hypothetical protein